MVDTKTDYDVIVVGGGPGGSTCSLFLNKYGYDVLLLDKAKFPRDKACGDGVTGKSMSVLRELNLTNVIEENNSHQIYNGLILYSADNQKLDMDFPNFYSYVCRRAVFDNILFQQTKKLVDVKEGFAVTGLIFENNQVVGIKGMDADTKQEMTFKAKVVVGADGANSVVAREVGLREFKPEHHASAIRVYYKNVKNLTTKLEIFFFDSIIPGYFWIFPLENNMANVGIGMLTSEVQRRNINLQAAMFKEIENNPVLVERFKDAELVEGSIRGWNLPLATGRRKLYGNGFVLLGDAGSLIDPFTGEGIGNALISAKIASKYIDEAIKAGDYSGKILKKYHDELWKIIGDEIKYSFLLQIAGKFKWLINRIFRKCVKSKDLRDLLSMSFASKEKQEKLSIWFGLRLAFKLIF